MGLKVHGTLGTGCCSWRIQDRRFGAGRARVFALPTGIAGILCLGVLCPFLGPSPLVYG